MNALTFDVEDYFQVSAFDAVIPRAQWDRWPSRVEHNTERLLELLESAGVRATFFTLGWVAERCPGLMRRVVAGGHELACHGYGHVKLTRMSRAELREELRRSKALLEDTGGVPVAGFRAASFSIGAANLWVYAEIEAAGFHYSSSVYPISHDHYGMPEAPRQPFRPEGCARLVEIPVSTVRIGARNFPAGGGGYFRLFPYALSRALIRRVNSEGLVANFYLHPWELDAEQPRPAGLSLRTRFRHYVNLGRVPARLARLVREFDWAPMAEAYREAIGACSPGMENAERACGSST